MGFYFIRNVDRYALFSTGAVQLGVSNCIAIGKRLFHLKHGWPLVAQCSDTLKPNQLVHDLFSTLYFGVLYCGSFLSLIFDFVLSLSHLPLCTALFCSGS